MKLTKDHPMFNTFLRLACRLSPENLSCDGECSRSEVQRRYAAISREWAAAEKMFGAAVTENDVWSADLSY